MMTRVETPTQPLMMQTLLDMSAHLRARSAALNCQMAMLSEHIGGLCEESQALVDEDAVVRGHVRLEAASHLPGQTD